jgi:hypothetical protein
MFVNGPLDGHADLKSKGLTLMNILELTYSLSKLKHHLLAHKKFKMKFHKMSTNSLGIEKIIITSHLSNKNIVF